MPALDDTSAAPSSSRGLFAFVALTLAFTSTFQLPAALARLGFVAGPPEKYMPLVALGAFGPLLSAIVVARWVEGPAGVRRIFVQKSPGGIGVGWYVAAPFMLGAIYVVGHAAYLPFSHGDAGRWLYLIEVPPQWVALVLFPLIEEPGWRGFALPRANARFGPRAASLVVGGVWALWHTMMFLTAGYGSSLVTMAILYINIVIGSVVFSWVYSRTRGSLFVAVLVHVGAHLNNPTHALPGQLAPFAVYTAALCVAAAVMWWGDRKAWVPETS